MAIGLAISMVSSAGESLTPETSPPAPRTEWWRDAVFYEIFVRSFQDSDGDGIGDFNGITQRLDDLQALGVTALWLMPIHPSPSDHGYDVLDYYAVNPDYGTMAYSPMTAIPCAPYSAKARRRPCRSAPAGSTATSPYKN